MKKMIGMAVLMVGLEVFGQAYDLSNWGVTNRLVNGALLTGTNNLGTNVLDVTRYTDVGLQVKFAGAGSGTEPMKVWLLRSADGTNWQSGDGEVWSVPAAGLAQVVAMTNLDVGALGYLKLRALTNGNSGDLTNVTLSAVLKGYRRDR